MIARLALVLLLAAGCVTSRSAKDEEAQLLGQALDGLFGKSKGGLLLRAETVPVTAGKSRTFPQDHAAIKKVLPAVTPELSKAFLDANRKKTTLAAPKTKLKVVLAPDKEIRAMMNDEGFDSVAKKHPGTRAIVTVSRPGFAEDFSRALLYVTEAKDDLGGEGALVFLKRDGDSWRVVKRAVLWSAG